MFSAASGFTGDFWERFLLEKVKFDIIFLPCLVISPPVSQDYCDPARGDGEGLAAGKCLWFFVIIGVGFLSFLVWVLSLFGLFPSIFEFSNSNCLQVELRLCQRRHQPTWKHQEMSRTQKISQKNSPRAPEMFQTKTKQPRFQRYLPGEIPSCTERAPALPDLHHPS